MVCNRLVCTVRWALIALVVACSGKTEVKINAASEGVDAQASVAWSGLDTPDGGPDGGLAPEIDTTPERTDGRRVDRLEGGRRALPVATLPGFRMLEGGGSRVFVEISGRADVKEGTRPGAIIYYLDGVRVPERVNRLSLPTRHFTTPVDRVRLVQIGDDAELVIELRVPSEAKTHLKSTSRGMVLSVDFDEIDKETLEKARLTYGRLRRDLAVVSKPAKKVKLEHGQEDAKEDAKEDDGYGD